MVAALARYIGSHIPSSPLSYYTHRYGTLSFRSIGVKNEMSWFGMRDANEPGGSGRAYRQFPTSNANDSNITMQSCLKDRSVEVLKERAGVQTVSYTHWAVSRVYIESRISMRAKMEKWRVVALLYTRHSTLSRSLGQSPLHFRTL